MPESILELLPWVPLALPAVLSLFCCRRWNGRWRFVAYAFGVGYIALGSALVIWMRGNGEEQNSSWLVLLAPVGLVVWVMIWGMHRRAAR